MYGYSPRRRKSAHGITRSHLKAGVLAVGTLLLLAGQTIIASSTVSAAFSPPRMAAAGHSGQLSQSHAHLPDGLYPALIKAEEHTTSPAYRIHSIGGALVGHNAADHFAFRFDRSGVAVSPSSSSNGGSLAIRFAGVGYGGVGVNTASSHREMVRPIGAGQRVSYHRGPIQEWYLNGPAGLEQGFTLAAPPHRDVARSVATPSKSLVLTLRVQGARSAHRKSGSIIFMPAGPHGSPNTSIQYGGLYVHDASGRRLPAHLALGTQRSGLSTQHTARGTRNSKLETRTVLLVIRDRGAHYPVTIDPTITAGPQYTLSTPCPASTACSFGQAVALSGDGRIALVGAPGAPGNGGAAYIFTEPGGGWATTGSPTAVLSVPGSGPLGFAVALNGDGSIALVGSFTGAYLFVEPSAGWLTTHDPTATLEGGSLVALNGDGSVALVSTAAPSGHAYVYTEPNSGWSGAPAPAATLSVQSTQQTNIGGAIALSEDGRVVLVYAQIQGGIGIGLEDAVYVFTEPSGGWATTGSPSATLGLPNDVGSFEVALSGDGATALVGLLGINSDTGEAYVFMEPSGGWRGTVNSSATLNVAGLPIHSQFGSSVSLSGAGDIALVGANNANGGQGAAYIFRKPANGWVSTSTPDETLSASGSGEFGGSLALSHDGTTALIGAPATNNGAGATYVQTTSAPLFVNSSGGSDTNNACTDITKPCLTIAHALTQAPSGATIKLAGAPNPFASGGIYCERLTIPRSMQLRPILVSHPVTIDGGGPGTVCSRAGPAPVISVGSTSAPAPTTYLSLSHLTIQHGGGALVGSFSLGGGILNAGGTVYLSQVAVTANTTSGENSVCPGGNAEGAGIENVSSGSLFLDQVSVSGNHAYAGSFPSHACDGGLADGGGIGNFGTLLVWGSTIAHNFAQGGDGGALNEFGGAGGGALGGGIENLGSLWMLGSTIYSNQAIGGAASVGSGGTAQGGGINNTGTPGPLTLVNSTIAVNSVEGGDGGSAAPASSSTGGGLSTSAGAFTLINDTVAYNQAQGLAGSGSGVAGTGGGISGPAGQTAAQLANTILATNIASNSDPDCSGVMADGVIQIANGPATVGHNLLGDESARCSGLTNGTNGDQVGTEANKIDPTLGTLAESGGPTQTFALGFGSPAIRAGDANGCSATWVGNLDQRGYPRNVGARHACDVGAYDTGGRPTVTGVSPNTGPTAGGNTVTINGTNFISGATVSFGGTPASSVTFVSSAQLTAVAPAHVQGTVNITVATPGGTSPISNAGKYTFGPPRVSSLSPNAGSTSGGNTVTINGIAFVPGVTVKFGSVSAGSVTFVTGTQLTAAAPAESTGTVDVTVTDAQGTSAIGPGDKYAYGPPTVTGVSPTAGPTAGVNTVTINGTSFVPGSAVKFGTVASSTVSFVSGTQLKAVAPAHSAGTVNLIVTTPEGTSPVVAADRYTYDLPPAVTSLSPDTGTTAGGNTVTINGAHFLAGATVHFGSTPSSSVTFVSSTQLKAVAPGQSTGSVNLTVTTPGGTSAISAADLYAYGPPTISSFTPSSGITGSTVTINGSAYARGVVVKFGTRTSPSVTILSGTQIKATVPNGAVPATISVSDAQGSATSSTSFTPTLSITSFSPSSGPTGTVVTINGRGFNGSSTVKFNGVTASSLTRVSSSELQATLPSTATTGPITVTNTTAPVGSVRSNASFTVT